LLAQCNARGSFVFMFENHGSLRWGLSAIETLFQLSCHAKILLLFIHSLSLFSEISTASGGTSALFWHHHEYSTSAASVDDRTTVHLSMVNIKSGPPRSSRSSANADPCIRNTPSGALTAWIAGNKTLFDANHAWLVTSELYTSST
jgi:hypothetical protein